MNASSSSKKEKCALVNPNLGHPLVLSIDPRLSDVNFTASVLFASVVENAKELESILQNNLTLVPILEYKWKLRQLLEKRKKEKEQKHRGKEREKKEAKKNKFHLFGRKKKKRNESNNPEVSTTSPPEIVEDELGFADEMKLKRLKTRVFRGEPLEVGVLKVSPAEIVHLNDLNFLDNEYTSPQDYLVKYDAFEGLQKFYKVEIKFALSEESLDFLKKKTFIMFDIVQKVENNGRKVTNRINYHSLVISKQEWKNFTFAHATDLHLAERNDQIYGMIKNWSKLFLKNLQIKTLEQQKKEIFQGEKPSVKKAFESLLPLKKRFINPNNQFRAFIKLINKKVLNNEIDFIALTGDLIDFSLLPELPKEIRKMFRFDYDQTNWKSFKEIVLNSNQNKRIGVIQGEELLCPIFTIPGNHDYRVMHYDLRWAGLYRKMGLKLEEALAINDKLLAFPITALTKTPKALKPYWEEINPSLDFSLKLGGNNFIFLNSGSDEFKNFRDLVSGHPSLTGLTIKQVKYLENLINNRIKQGENTFLLLHGPPINPKQKRSIIKRLEKKMGKVVRTHLYENKESVLKKIGKKEVKTRIDQHFNTKFGTVSANWEKLIKFCREYCVLTLAGHTHDLKEFRLQDPSGVISKVFNAPPFSLKKIETPAAIFYDEYSELYTNAKEIEKFGPFVVQTPSLGLGSFKETRLAGAYRLIVIKNEKLTSFRVLYLNG